ncbi:MAG: hypothetical protein ABSC61_08990 [Anaerolineales bacterium]
MKKILIPIAIFALLGCICPYIAVPADLLVTPTSTASKGWSTIAINLGKSDAGDLHIDLAIRNDTQDWSAMQADEGKPAVLTASDGKKTNCDTVFVGTGGTSLAPGFQMRGYTAGTKAAPKIQLLYVECKGAVASSGANLSIGYSYVTGAYDLHVPSVPVSGTMKLDLDQVAKDVTYPVATPITGLIEKVGDKINAINSFTLTLTDAKRTNTGLELDWQDFNPSDYANYVHIGTPPVIGADGILYGLYEDPSIADATIALSKSTAEWTTTVTVPSTVKGLYVLVSVETRQSKYFVSHVIDITDK